MSDKLVPYYRVSTKKQGESGLGLDAQHTAFEAYARQNGGTQVGEYIEVESGKRSDRPELRKAIEHAKAVRGKLVVAKLDRLARNVLFTATLLESGVDFVACDMPNANRTIIQIMAAIAEGEARAISERTTAALAAAKARGVKMGSACPGHWDKAEDRRRAGQEKGLPLARAARSQEARDFYRPVVTEIKEQREAGKTLAEVAEALNSKGFTTRNGHPFARARVSELIQRYLGEEFLGRADGKITVSS
jgi:DNA invertase Pin-like site-specific DNA recombinase